MIACTLTPWRGNDEDGERRTTDPALFEDGDRALMSADCGRTAAHLRRRLCAVRRVRQAFHSAGSVAQSHFWRDSISLDESRTGRRIRILRDDVAVVHGSEDDVIEQGGEPLPVRYVYMDVVMKRDESVADCGVAVGEVSRGLIAALSCARAPAKVPRFPRLFLHTGWVALPYPPRTNERTPDATRRTSAADEHVRRPSRIVSVSESYSSVLSSKLIPIGS